MIVVRHCLVCRGGGIRINFQVGDRELLSCPMCGGTGHIVTDEPTPLERLAATDVEEYQT